MGYGKQSVIHTSKILTLSEDLPRVIEIVDTNDKIESFLDDVNNLFDETKSGGLITIEKARVIKY